MKKLMIALGAASLAIPQVAVAQDDEALIIVTGSRVDREDYDEYYDDEQAAIGLTRKGDFFVKSLFVSSDSRDADVRKAEVTTMLKETVAAAEAQGIALVAGNYTLQPVTLETIDELNFGRGRRPDTTRVTIYARLTVGGQANSVDDANEIITPFVKSIPANGRSYIETGSTSLAITNPDQYRGAVVRTIANEAKSYAAMFGSDYGVEIRGLDSELYFKQASETEVFLYIGHSFVIKPK